MKCSHGRDYYCSTCPDVDDCKERAEYDLDITFRHHPLPWHIQNGKWIYDFNGDFVCDCEMETDENVGSAFTLSQLVARTIVQLANNQQKETK